MSNFELPPIQDNPDGGWGPSPSNFPQDFKFKDIPYAPFSKADKIGRFADWNDLTGDGRQGSSGQGGGYGARSAAAGGRKREGQQAFGSGISNAFAYFHVDDEASFSLVDNKASGPRRGGSTFGRGRASFRGSGASSRGGQRGGRGGFTPGRGGGQRGGRRGWRDWEKV